ncbi:hypothetical protein KP509_26G007300 [Ceratopteris richardii]|uniref:Reverse transcriptase zinc-binding domain-containing protein n=1 Tax=Ceratopteris richardii TaxID=49495 RepID=A0A8T2RKD7_CERRI|nr:hypothetical protein KP509_26G007300 [Ceratopteris richardii]
MHKVKCKTGLWHASQWPLHARVKIVQAFLQPYIMYYLLLLDWKKCQSKDFECLLKNFLWEKKHSRALVLSSWDFVCQPKANGGLGILNLHSHTIARRAAFITRITSAHNPLWLDIFWKIIENEEVRFKGTWKVDAWNKFFSHAPLYSSSPTLNFLLRSFKSALSYLKWNGRQPYVGNSFASLSPYWYFLFHSIWYSSFTFKLKIFMWRIFVGHFTLGAFLSKHGLQGAQCPHCSSYAENMRHAF